jgi:hypothetical protein
MSKRNGLSDPTALLWYLAVSVYRIVRCNVAITLLAWFVYVQAVRINARSYVRYRARRFALWYLLSYRGYHIGERCATESDLAVLGLLRWSAAPSGGVGVGRYVSVSVRWTAALASILLMACREPTQSVTPCTRRVDTVWSQDCVLRFIIESPCDAPITVNNTRTVCP